MPHCLRHAGLVLQSLKLAVSEMQCAAGAWDMLLKQHVAASSALASLSPELAPELLAFITLLMLVRSLLWFSCCSVYSARPLRWSRSRSLRALAVCAPERVTV